MNYRQATPKEIAASLRGTAAQIAETQFERKPTAMRRILDDAYRGIMSNAKWLESQDYGAVPTRQITTERNDAEQRLCTVAKTLLSLGATPDEIVRQVRYAVEEVVPA